jgi:hypothetical protein
MAVLLALGAGYAVAHTTHYDTGIEARGADRGTPPNDADVIYYGKVTSPKFACLRDRTVEWVIHRSAHKDLVKDVGHTSRYGAWALKANVGAGATPSDATSVDVIALRKNIGPPGHRHVCRRTSVLIFGSG